MSGLFEKLETARAEAIPFGPLTREDFDFLNRPFMFLGVEKVARERGMTPGGSLKNILTVLGYTTPGIPTFRGKDFDDSRDKGLEFDNKPGGRPLIDRSIIPVGKASVLTFTSDAVDGMAAHFASGERIILAETHPRLTPPVDQGDGAVREIFPEGFRKPQ